VKRRPRCSEAGQRTTAPPQPVGYGGRTLCDLGQSVAAVSFPDPRADERWAIPQRDADSLHVSKEIDGVDVDEVHLVELQHGWSIRLGELPLEIAQVLASEPTDQSDGHSTPVTHGVNP